jgi:hypothetical protein
LLKYAGETLSVSTIAADVNIAKTSPCTIATIDSSNKNGSGAKNANNPEIVDSTTSPAYILPKSRNESEKILINSETNSNNPTNNKIGFHEKNRFK